MSTRDGNVGGAGDVAARPKARARYDPESDRELSLVVAQCVADAAGVEPVDLDQQMYASVDPDAVERVFSGFGTPAATRGHLAFEFCEHTVVVSHDGLIAVYD